VKGINVLEPSISFAPATENDAEHLAALRVQAMRPSLEQIGRFDPQRARERFLSNFSPEYTRHILFDGVKVGFLVVRPEQDALLLDHLYIQSDYQGKGIGSMVLNDLFSVAVTQEKVIRVGALRGSASNEFYVRHGFKLLESAEWDNYYVRQIDHKI
jgi:GNAT superfamily N-acetyltransferase